MEKVLIGIHAALGIQEQHLAANRLLSHPQPAMEDLRVIDSRGETRLYCLRFV